MGKLPGGKIEIRASGLGPEIVILPDKARDRRDPALYDSARPRWVRRKRELHPAVSTVVLGEDDIPAPSVTLSPGSVTALQNLTVQQASDVTVQQPVTMQQPSDVTVQHGSDVTVQQADQAAVTPDEQALIAWVQILVMRNGCGRYVGHAG